MRDAISFLKSRKDLFLSLGVFILFAVAFFFVLGSPKSGVTTAHGAGVANLHATTANFSSVWSSAVGGDVIALSTGNYGTFSGGSKSGVVTIQPEPGATPVMSLSFTPADHIKLDGLTIAGAQLSGAHDITISNSVFTVAVLLRTSGVLNANILFDHDIFDNLPVDTYEGRLSVIGSSDTSPVGVIISNSHFGGGCSDGVDVLGGAYGVVIGPGNEFTGITQNGCDPVHADPIQFYGDSHTTVTGNWFHDNGTGSGGIMTPDGSSGGVITNNVFGSTGYAFAINCGGCTGFLFSHNTVNPSQSIHFAVSNEGANSSGNTITNNVAQGGIQSQGSTEDYNLVSGGGSGSYDISGNPTYVGGSVPNSYVGYKLASNSLGLGRAGDGTDMGVNTAGAGTPPVTDTTPPSASTGLSATAMSSSQINLSWTASTDNVGVTGYKIYRGGTQIGSSLTNSFTDTGLSSSKNYSYTVSADDAAGNNSSQSASANATTQSATTPPPVGGAPVFVQSVAISRDASGGALTTPSITTASGHLFVVAVAWDDSTNATISVSDSKGNAYAPATTKQTYAANASNLQIFYAANGVGGPSHTFTVTPSANAPWFRVVVHEVSGIQSVSPVDQTALINSEAGTAVSVGPLTTTASGDYIFAVADDNSGTNTIAPNAPYAERATAGPALAQLQSQDTVQSSAGSIASTWTLSGTDTVMAQMVAFKSGAVSGADTQSPSVPGGLTATAISPSAVNLAWTASTDNIGVTGYKIYRGGVQIGVSTVNAYADTGLTASTAYSYTVSAFDAAGNASSQSAPALVTTQSVAPVIISLIGSNATAHTNDLAWTTDVLTNGQVFYGLSSAYGSSSAIVDNIAKTTTHAVTLSNLSPATRYHFKVVSINGSGQSTSSPDFTFTTLPIGPIVSYIPSVPGLPTTGGVPMIFSNLVVLIIIILVILIAAGIAMVMRRKKKK